MRSILPLKKIYFKDHFSKFNTNGMSDKQVEKTKRYCRAVAEVRAFIDTIIDREYRNLSIFDLNGETKNGQKALDPQEAMRAKNLVCKYIWGYNWKELVRKFRTENDIKKYVSKNSVLMRRLENGNNVVIYGGTNSPCGRTMIASIIMKEVIRMRLYEPNIISHTYDWVDFKSLIDELREHSDKIPDYKTADWLVVDNIYCPNGETDGQISYRINLSDPFFMYRLKNNLPTILVFQYDIRSSKEALYKKMGIGISNLVNNQRVCKVPLSKRN